jgi:hypothetical protein
VEHSIFVDFDFVQASPDCPAKLIEALNVSANTAVMDCDVHVLRTLGGHAIQYLWGDDASVQMCLRHIPQCLGIEKAPETLFEGDWEEPLAKWHSISI